MARSKNSKANNRAAKTAAQHKMLHQLQSALGLATSPDPGSSAVKPPPVDLDDKPAIGSCERASPVLVSIDIETWEVNNSTITEIGFAVLDPQHLHGRAPQDRGVGWWPQVYARHLWVRECMHMVNREYVTGCPENFNFGETDIISQDSKLELTRSFLQEVLKNDRPLYVVGHDLKQDIEYLDNMGLMIESMATCVEFIDSREIYALFMNLPQGPSLGSILNGLQLESRNLHNAGNDAVYTLRACLALATILAEDDSQAYKLRGYLE
ncbi:hypothetical protein BROUX41_002484 [Berkeleyomyces rouxiae]|uniref:uncharacterized protein n=1 Tax=Berkeleyomyces rouxiae TaxID=2035830 RepID=UPI003B7AE3E3